MTFPTPAGLGPVHHLAYVVDNLEDAARRWHELTGIGPFLVLPHVAFDEVLVDGAPATFDHTPAFAAHHGLFVELQLLHRVEPAAAAPRFAGRGPAGLHHIAHVVPDAAAESRRLVGLGLPEVIRARTGALAVHIHDAAPVFGAHLELHQASDFLTAFFDRVRAAADGWNGQDLLQKAALD